MDGTWGSTPPATDAGTDLVFSLSRTDISTAPDGFEVPEGSAIPRPARGRSNGMWR